MTIAIPKIRVSGLQRPLFVPRLHATVSGIADALAHFNEYDSMYFGSIYYLVDAACFIYLNRRVPNSAMFVDIENMNASDFGVVVFMDDYIALPMAMPKSKLHLVCRVRGKLQVHGNVADKVRPFIDALSERRGEDRPTLPKYNELQWRRHTGLHHYKKNALIKPWTNLDNVPYVATSDEFVVDGLLPTQIAYSK